MPRVCKTITVATAGTPVNLATGTTSAPQKGGTPQWAKNVLVQALHGSSAAFGYLLTAEAGTVPSHSTSGQLVAEIPPASSTGPGTPVFEYSDVGRDLNTVWVDASHSGDAFAASWDQ
jgi:hypothetical protein